jgi:hypothetical protein
VAKGFHRAGFNAEVSWLPSDLVQAADHRLTLPTLTAGDIGRIANRLCGDASAAMLSDAQAAQVTPRLLWLALSPGQTADAYIGSEPRIFLRPQSDSGHGTLLTHSPN